MSCNEFAVVVDEAVWLEVNVVNALAGRNLKKC